MASNSLRRSSTGTLPPTWALVSNLHAFGAHLLQAAVDQMLLHLEIGDAVAQQPADAVALFEDRDVVPGARQLLRRGQAGRSRAHHRHALAGARGARLRA